MNSKIRDIPNNKNIRKLHQSWVNIKGFFGVLLDFRVEGKSTGFDAAVFLDASFFGFGLVFGVCLALAVGLAFFFSG